MRPFMFVLLVCYCSISLCAQDKPDFEDGQVAPAATNGDTSPVIDGSAAQTQDPTQQAPQTHPVATTYSNGYEVRLKIHKYASWATVPLFATELALGQSLYNNPETGAKKTAHGIVGTGIVALFGLNTFTGAWNLWEGRHDTDGRKTKIIHSILMFAADGGFLATTATGPHVRNGIITNPSDKSLHRDIAIGSISVGTAGYLLMLLKGK